MSTLTPSSVHQDTSHPSGGSETNDRFSRDDTGDSISQQARHPPVLVIVCNTLAANNVLAREYRRSPVGPFTTEKIRSATSQFPDFVKSFVMWRRSTESTEHANASDACESEGKELPEALTEDSIEFRGASCVAVWRDGMTQFVRGLVSCREQRSRDTYVVDLSSLSRAARLRILFYSGLAPGHNERRSFDDETFDRFMSEWETYRT
jgi:hypothetical protein